MIETDGGATETMASQPHAYEFRIEGRLSARWATWFRGLKIHHTGVTETALSGIVEDQAALHGILMKIRDLGLPLVAVRRLPNRCLEGEYTQNCQVRRNTMTRDEAIAYIKDVEFGYLATVGTDQSPRVRPVGMKDVYGDAIYFFTFRNTRKVAEIANTPQVEVVWSKPGTMSQVRIRGGMVEETDPAIQAQFQADNPMVGKLLPPGAEGLFLLYRLVPETVELARTLGPYEVVSW